MRGNFVDPAIENQRDRRSVEIVRFLCLPDDRYVPSGCERDGAIRVRGCVQQVMFLAAIGLVPRLNKQRARAIAGNAVAFYARALQRLRRKALHGIAPDRGKFAQLLHRGLLP